MLSWKAGNSRKLGAHTLHKSGDVNVPGNFRGISLLSVAGKIFTKILNERLVKWPEFENKYFVEQAGFRKRFSTMNQIFNLYTMCENYLSKKGPGIHFIY